MKKKFRKIFALTLVLSSVLCTAAACSNANGNAGIPREYSVNVTYYLPQGEFDTYSGKKYLEIYYMPNSKIAEPNVSATSFSCSYKGHSLEGWYVAEKDGDGKVVTEEDGTPKASSTKFDFNEKVSENITLVAVWSRKIRLTYNNYYLLGGKNLNRIDCKDGGQISRPTTMCFDSSNQSHTIEGFYWNYDEATGTYSDEIQFPLTYEYLDRKAEDAEPDEKTKFVMLYAYVKYAD